VSEPERDVDEPAAVRAGVWANDVDAYGDLEDVTLDFIRVGPRSSRKSILVARVTLPPSAIIKLEHELERSR
jgi:hypothetical protein